VVTRRLFREVKHARETRRLYGYDPAFVRRGRAGARPADVD